MRRRRDVEVEFNALLNSVHASKLGLGFASESSNSTTERGILEGDVRYGSVTTYDTTGTSFDWTTNWVAYGFAYGTYTTEDGLTTYEEYLAIVRDPVNNSAGKAYLFTINPTTGVWTKVTKGGVAVEVTASDWQFETFFDKDGKGRFYGVNETDGIYRRVIGGGSNDDEKWQQVNPEFRYGLVLQASLDRPPYAEQDFSAGQGSLTVVNRSGFASATASVTSSGSIKVKYVAAAPTDLYAQLVFTFTSTKDWTGVDRILIRIRNLRDAALDVRDPRTGRLPTVGFSTDGVTAINQAFIDGMEKATYKAVGIGEDGQQNDGYAQDVFIVAELKDIATATKSSIKRICIAVEGNRNNNSNMEYEVYPVVVGGAYLYDLGDGNTYPPHVNNPENPGGSTGGGTSTTSSYPEFEYAYTYYGTALTEDIESNAVRATMSPNLYRGSVPLQGYDTANSKWTMWSWIELNPPYNATLAGDGYDKIRIYRKVKTGGNPGSDDWYYMGQIDNSPGTPSYIDKIRASVILSTPGTYPKKVGLNFGDFTETIRGTSIAAWKGHMVYGIDRKLYMSWEGSPTKLLPDPDVDFVPPNALLDPGGGRTVFMSRNKADTVRGIAPADTLFPVGEFSAYGIIGDSAILSSKPREARNGRGSVSFRGTMPYDGGAVVTARDGLWWFSVARVGQDDEETVLIGMEMTKEVRESWSRLLGTTVANWLDVSVAYHDDELWVFGPGVNNTGRYLKLSRPRSTDGQRVWSEGTFPKMCRAISDRKHGFRGLTENGRFIRIGRDSSGNKYTTDSGSSVNWSWTTGVQLGPRERLVEIYLKGSGTPALAVDVNDGIKGDVSPSAMTQVASRVWQLSVNVLPGFEHQLTLSGVVGTDTVEKLVLIFEDEGEGFGN